MVELEMLVDFHGTARWRRGKAEQYPKDDRNSDAAALLEKLGEEAAALTGSEAHRNLDRAFQATGEARDMELSRFNVTVSEHLRWVGFGYKPANVSAFIADLVADLR